MLAMPVAVSHVSDMMVNTADALMVGPLGAVPLAGVTLASAVSYIVMLFTIGFTAAITPLAGEAFGRRNMGDVAIYAKAGTIVSTAVVVALVCLLYLFSNRLDVLGSPPDVTQEAIPYFRWIVLSFIWRILFGSFKQTAEAMSNTRVSMIINLACNVVNIGLNWVFIYGNLGMPEMGAEGAGFATFLSRGLAALTALAVFLRTSFFQDLRNALRSSAPSVSTSLAMTRIVRNGIGIGLQILMEVLAFALGAIMLGWVGATALSAHQIAINMASITFMVALGIGSAATIRISNLLGVGQPAEARLVVRAALLLVVVYMTVVGIVYLTFRYQLPELYIQDRAVVHLAAHLLLYGAAFSLFDGLQVVGLGILRGYNDITIPTVLASVSYIGVTIPASYVGAFVLKLGAEGIWLGYLVGLAVASIGYLWRIKKILNGYKQIAAEDLYLG